MWPWKKPETPSPFSLEYYPLTKRYYPKYKEFYMQKDYSTRIWEAVGDHLFKFASWSETEAGAEEMIEEFSEHVLKKNIVIKEIILVEEE
jgi:hypothetical protein